MNRSAHQRGGVFLKRLIVILPFQDAIKMIISLPALKPFYASKPVRIGSFLELIKAKISMSLFRNTPDFSVHQQWPFSQPAFCINRRKKLTETDRPRRARICKKYLILPQPSWAGQETCPAPLGWAGPKNSRVRMI